VERREFLAMLAAGVATAGLSVAALEYGPSLLGQDSRLLETEGALTLPDVEVSHPSDPILPEVVSVENVNPAPFYAPTTTRVKVPAGTISAIKGHKGMLALTVDDGISSHVVREYANFAKKTGMRLTFFATGMYASWRENAELLKPLVDSGQIQMANHTWTHADLQKSADSVVAGELKQMHDFLSNTYGINAAPFFRPPYGNHDSRVDKIAAGLGYTTPVMWDGSLSDAGLITTDQVKQFAAKYLTEERIVIGHANYSPVTECFDYIKDLIVTRGITPVTLNDLYLKT
jgi:peptidoglycan/xylan/chitin deacetylase (PgdA/CDA1 family)